MICLIMDTAGTACSAGLYDSENGLMLGEVSEEIGKGHAERLMNIIADVMERAKVTYHDIDRIITTTGPGSFTGIRVGVATARGFGVGLGIPVVGVSNLEAILDDFAKDNALDTNTSALGIAITAGRGQAYCLFNVDTEFALADTPFVADLDALQKAFSERSSPILLCGTAAAEIAGSDSQLTSVTAEKYSRAMIATVARLGAAIKDVSKKPEPLYLRKPDAVPQKGFAVERVG